MPSLIVCRGRGADPRSMMTSIPAFDIKAACTKELKRARKHGWEVAHIFADWPQDTSLLPGCGPIATEAVFKGTYVSLLECPRIEDFILSAAGKSVTLIGTIGVSVLANTIESASKLGLDMCFKGRCLRVLQDYEFDTHRSRSA